MLSHALLTPDTGLGDEGYLALASALRRCGSLQELDIGNYDMGRKQISGKGPTILVNSLPQSLVWLGLRRMATS